jgi:hypothetical protein
MLIDHTLVSSLSFADDLVIFSESHKGLQNALHKLQKYCFDKKIWNQQLALQKEKNILISPRSRVIETNLALLKLSVFV